MRTEHRLIVTALCWLLAPRFTNGAEDCSLSFSIPEGWLNLSPGAPAENFQQAPEELAQTARSGLFEVFAIRQSRYHDYDTMTVNIQPAAIPLDENLIEVLGNRVLEQLGTAEMPWKILQKSMVEIEGVPAGRLLLGAPSIFGQRALVYYMPGENCTGILMYHTNGTNLRDIAESLDASAMRTRGLAPAPKAGFWFTLLVNSEARWKLGLLFVGGFIAIAIGVTLYHRKSRGSAPRRPGPRSRPPARVRR